MKVRIVILSYIFSLGAMSQREFLGDAPFTFYNRSGFRAEVACRDLCCCDGEAQDGKFLGFSVASGNDKSFYVPYGATFFCLVKLHNPAGEKDVRLSWLKNTAKLSSDEGITLAYSHVLPVKPIPQKNIVLLQHSKDGPPIGVSSFRTEKDKCVLVAASVSGDTCCSESVNRVVAHSLPLAANVIEVYHRDDWGIGQQRRKDADVVLRRPLNVLSFYFLVSDGRRIFLKDEEHWDER